MVVGWFQMGTSWVWTAGPPGTPLLHVCRGAHGAWTVAVVERRSIQELPGRYPALDEAKRAGEAWARQRLEA